MTTVLTLTIALLLDTLLGEPRRFHPLVGFGLLAQRLESMLYQNQRLNGLIAALILLVPFTLLAYFVSSTAGGFVFNVICLYFAIGWKSLEEHACRVRHALTADNLPEARRQAGLMVSRDTAALDQEGIAKATIESVLENGNDALFGALFWFIIAGAPGCLFYRLANTLDAMWGYRTDRYIRFGWAAARLDDLLNFIPARLTALSYAIVGQTRSAFFCWHTQGTQWKSPNAGPVMAAGAGSLKIQLGGTAYYHGIKQTRPFLGEGPAATCSDIDRAQRLIQRALLLWLLVLLFGGILVSQRF